MQPGSLVQQSFTRSFLGCIVYVSEGRSKPIIDQLETVARHASRHVKLASLFQDSPYNRSNFCLVGRDVHHLALAAVHLSRAAFQLVDLERHAATHPRLGVVDHISCHPLGSLQADPEGLRHAASLARTLGQQLGAGDQAVPVYLYGAAHPQHHSLDSIRRSLGYFQGAAQGQWRGAIPMAAPSCQQSGSGSAAEAPHPTPLPLTPDFGLPHARPSRGVCCVGASPWVVNFNVLLSEGVGRAAAREIARRVSERGGGLRGVQAMALQHSKGVEIACNLLDPHGIPPEAVERRVAELAQAEGGSVVDSYRIGMGPEDLLDIARQL